MSKPVPLNLSSNPTMIRQNLDPILSPRATTVSQPKTIAWKKSLSEEDKISHNASQSFPAVQKNDAFPPNRNIAVPTSVKTKHVWKKSKTEDAPRRRRASSNPKAVEAASSSNKISAKLSSSVETLPSLEPTTTKVQGAAKKNTVWGGKSKTSEESKKRSISREKIHSVQRPRKNPTPPSVDSTSAKVEGTAKKNKGWGSKSRSTEEPSCKKNPIFEMRHHPQFRKVADEENEMPEDSMPLSPRRKGEKEAEEVRVVLNPLLVKEVPNANASETFKRAKGIIESCSFSNKEINVLFLSLYFNYGTSDSLILSQFLNAMSPEEKIEVMTILIKLAIRVEMAFAQELACLSRGDSLFTRLMHKLIDTHCEPWLNGIIHCKKVNKKMNKAIKGLEQARTFETFASASSVEKKLNPLQEKYAPLILNKIYYALALSLIKETKKSMPDHLKNLLRDILDVCSIKFPDENYEVIVFADFVFRYIIAPLTNPAQLTSMMSSPKKFDEKDHARAKINKVLIPLIRDAETIPDFMKKFYYQKD
jgi:hypothetical protein